MAEPFDNLAGRFSNQDTLGSGSFPAPSDSGQKRSPLMDSMGAFRASTGERMTLLEASRGNFDKPKGGVWSRLTQGDRWGGNAWHLGGGFHLPNPLKTALSGLSWLGENFSDPINGLVMGGMSQVLFNNQQMGKTGRMSYLFKEKMEGVTGGFWDRWAAAGEFTREREGLFWGEKFLSGTITDPLSYVGFGLAGRLPVVGRQLGWLEGGFISATNVPFRLGGKAWKQLPKTRGQNARIYGDDVFDELNQVLVEAGQGRSPNDVVKFQLDKVRALSLNPTIPYNALPTNAHRKLRDYVLDEKKLSHDETTKMANQFAKEVKVKLDPEELSQLGDGTIRLGASDLIERTIRGSDGLNPTEAAEELLRVLHIPIQKESMDAAELYLKKRVERAYRQAHNKTDALSPQQLRVELREKAVRIYEVNQKNGFQDTLTRMGVAGAIVGHMDKWQTRYIQNGLRKSIIRPMAAMVLMFPTFPLQERMETMSRQLFGRSGVGYDSAADYSRSMTFYKGIPTELAVERGGLFTTAATSRVDATDAAALSSLLKKMGLNPKQFDPNSTKGKVLKWMMPNEWLRQATDASVAGRRHYHKSRSVQRMTSELVNNNPELASIIEKIPDELSGKYGQRIFEDAILRAGTGDVKALRNLGENFTSSEIHRREFRNMIDRWDDISPMNKELLDNFAENSVGLGKNMVDMKGLDDVFAQMEKNDWTAFVDGAEAARINMSFAGDALRQIDTTNIRGVESALYQFDHSIRGLSQRVERINRTAVREANSVRFQETQRYRVYKESQDKVDAVLKAARTEYDDIMKEIRRVEIEAFGESYVANSFRDEFVLLEEQWSAYHKLRTDLFDAAGKDGRDADFWDNLVKESDEFWSNAHKARRKVYDIRETAEQSMRTKTASYPAPKIQRGIDFSKGTVGAREIGMIVGAQGDQVAQGVMMGAFYDREDFVDYVMRKAESYAHTGLSKKTVGKAYDQMLDSVGLTDELLKGFGKHRIRLDSLKDEAKGAARTSSYGPAQETAMSKYVNDIAAQMELEDLGAMKMRGQAAVDKATEDMKMNFVNYSDVNFVDDMMATIMPFWTYEARRMPWLLQHSMSHPVIAQSFGPEGRYWEATDNGYIPAGALPWADINLFSGTMFNAPRRLMKGNMPPEYTSGVKGGFSKAEDYMNQMGFYFGSHINLTRDAFVNNDVTGGLGEASPPPLNIGLAAMAGYGTNIPGVSELANQMRTRVMPDKFRNFLIAKVMWEKGINPGDIDFESMKPRPGVTGITDEDIRSVLAASARAEFLQETTGMVRYRGENEQKFREEKDQIYKNWSGLSQKELDELKRNRVSISSVVALPPDVQATLSELEGNEEYAASLSLLTHGEHAERVRINAEYWDNYTANYEDTKAKQVIDDQAWSDGVMAPNTWRKRLGDRKVQLAAFGYRSRGRDENNNVINPQARYVDVPVSYDDYVAQATEMGMESIALQHPVKQAVQLFYEVRPMDNDGDGEPEWSEFFAARDEVLAQVPKEIAEAVIEQIEENMAPAELMLRQMQRGRLGNYWRIQDDVASQMGMTDFISNLTRTKKFNKDLAARIEQSAAFKAYNKEVNRRKELARLSDAKLDYALGIYGFTGQDVTFKNPQAKSWWLQDGYKPNLGHLMPRS